MITKAQLKKMHVLLNRVGIMHIKRKIVEEYSLGRVTSSKDLTKKEASDIIRQLEYSLKWQETRNKIFKIAIETGVIWWDFELDKEDDELVIYEQLNLFMKRRGTIKKDIDEMDLSELNRVHRQFLAIKKSHSKTKFNKELKSVLTEIGIGI